MYKLARLMVMQAVVYFGIAIVMLCLIVGWPGWVVLALIVAGMSKKKSRMLTALGSAHFASKGALRYAGMLGGKRGLFLGRVGKAGNIEKLDALFNRHLSSREACEICTGGKNVELVRLPDAVHTAVFAPTGVGKGVSLITPFLLTCEESCIVVDVKDGENASITAWARQRMGHEIVILDPMHLVTSHPDTFDPIDFISRDSLEAIDDCNALAQAIVVRTGEEKEPHWLDRAEAWIAAVLALVVWYGQREVGTRSLQKVAEILSCPEQLEAAVTLMCKSDAWGGMLRRMGGQLRHSNGDELGSTLSTVGRFIRFLNTPAIAASTATSSFHPVQLLRRKMTIYLILPLKLVRARSPLLRLWVGSLLRAVMSDGLQQGKKVHVILDEMHAIGALQSIEDMLSIGRGYSLRLQMYFQSLGQVSKCFPQGQEQTLLSNTTQIFFGVNDVQTAEYVSKRLGQQTIRLDSGGSNRGYSHQTSPMTVNSSQTYSSGGNTNWQQQSRELLKMDEVIGLSPRTALTFTPGVAPVISTLLRYYEEKRLFDHKGWFSEMRAACGMFFRSMCLLLLSIGAVAFAAEELKEGMKTNGKTTRHAVWPHTGRDEDIHWPGSR